MPPRDFDADGDAVKSEMKEFKNILNKQVKLTSRNTKVIKKVQDRRRFVFKDQLTRSPEDLLAQNNIMLRTYVQQSSVER